MYEKQIEKIESLKEVDFYNFEKELKEFPKTVKWIKQCYNFPNRIDIQLEVLNEILEGYGIEVLNDENYWNSYFGSARYLYVNMGDTYILTVIYDTENSLFIESSWGDIYEKNENQDNRHKF